MLTNESKFHPSWIVKDATELSICLSIFSTTSVDAGISSIALTGSSTLAITAVPATTPPPPPI